jgi:nucleoside-diphosphate-sugar epimerase
MKILVTGSAGHLGEALMRSLEDSDHEATGLDIKASPFTRRERTRTVLPGRRLVVLQKLSP